MLPYVRPQMQLIPLNVALNRQELSLKCSIFALGESKHCQLTMQVDQIDGTFLFGNARPPQSALALSPFFLSQ